MPFQNAPAPLARALAARGFTAPTAVQAAVLADDAKNRDLLVSARTGSGKTVAFGLTLADLLLNDAGRCVPSGAPIALVIAPTRNLPCRCVVSWNGCMPKPVHALFPALVAWNPARKPGPLPLAATLLWAPLAACVTICAAVRLIFHT